MFVWGVGFPDANVATLERLVSSRSNRVGFLSHVQLLLMSHQEAAEEGGKTTDKRNERRKLRNNGSQSEGDTLHYNYRPLPKSMGLHCVCA